MNKVFLICTMCLMAISAQISPADNNSDTDTSGYVDLGLSVKWATCNLGATKPEEMGDYYAWGETSIKLDYGSFFEYKWSYDGTYNTLNKYNTKHSFGVVDKKKVLDAEDDAAHVKLGGKWRIPTRAEWSELMKKCTWTWTTQGGVNGYKVTSKINGESIFLPTTLYRDRTRVGPDDHGSYHGYYWSSSLCTVEPDEAWNMYLASIYFHMSHESRCRGMSVRPVTE